MNVSHSIQASWNDGNSFTAPLSAVFGTRYALALVNDVYELQSVGEASTPAEIQVGNDVGESVSITFFVDGDPVIVQPSVAHAQMALFAMTATQRTASVATNDAPVRVEYLNASADDTLDEVLVFQHDVPPSFDAIAAAWLLIRHVPPGGGSVFDAPRMPLYFGLVRNIVESAVLYSATMSVSFTTIDLTNAGDTATVRLTGDAAGGYTFALAD